MRLETYLDLKQQIVELEFGDEIEWAANVRSSPNAEHFASETIWVILNAGMKAQVARIIEARIWPLLQAGDSSSGGFKHQLKCRAIDEVWTNRAKLFEGWQAAEDKLAYCETLPHIGPITKYHLARNLGLDFCKPDRHLVRIAGDETPVVMCQRLADATGDRIGVVDCVIWRAANLGLV